MTYTNKMNIKVGDTAGHGGSDPGACAFGYKEKNLALDIKNYTDSFLMRRGITVYTNRKTDKDSSINSKTAMLNRAGVVCTNETHINAGGGEGGEVFYHPDSPEGKKLAKCILDALVEYAGQKSRGIKASQDLGMINYTDMPSVLTEVAFIDNKKDVAKIHTKKERKKYGNAIAKGICNYLGIRWVSYKIRTTCRLKVREKPTSLSKKVHTYEKGAEVMCYRLSAKGKWGLTSKGWVNLKYTKKV